MADELGKQSGEHDEAGEQDRENAEPAGVGAGEPPARRRRPRRLLTSLAIGPLAAAFNALVCGPATVISIVLGILAPVVVALVWELVIDLGDDPFESDTGAWIAMFLMVASTGLASTFSGLGELAVWVPGGEVTPAEVGAHRWARVFTLHDAETQPALAGVHRVRGKKGSTTYAVVPLVPAGWTRDAPVPAWAVCPEARCQGVTRQPRFAARPATFVQDGLPRAAAQAAAAHGLQAAPGAPVLEVGGSAGEVLRRRGYIPLVTAVVFGVPWQIALAVGWLRRRRQGARGEG